MADVMPNEALSRILGSYSLGYSLVTPPRQAPACHLCPFVVFSPCMYFIFYALSYHCLPLVSLFVVFVFFAVAAVSSFIIIYALFICVYVCMCVYALPACKQ